MAQANADKPMTARNLCRITLVFTILCACHKQAAITPPILDPRSELPTIYIEPYTPNSLRLVARVPIKIMVRGTLFELKPADLLQCFLDIDAWRCEVAK
jgi:hypothetical protein